MKKKITAKKAAKLVAKKAAPKKIVSGKKKAPITIAMLKPKSGGKYGKAKNG